MFHRWPCQEHSREISISHNILIHFLKVHKLKSNIWQLNITLAFIFLSTFVSRLTTHRLLHLTGAVTRWGNREGRVGVKVTNLDDWSSPQCLEVAHS